MFHYGPDSVFNCDIRCGFYQPRQNTHPSSFSPIGERNSSFVKAIADSHLNKIGLAPLTVEEQNKERTSWKGDFKTRDFSISPLIFSNKIFIGGIPMGMTRETVICIFQKFDSNLSLQWPDKNSNSISTCPYLRIVMSSNENVLRLLESCEFVVVGGCETFNYEILYKNKTRYLQIVPWLSSDSSFIRNPVCISNVETKNPLCVPNVETKFTVFVGALHGRMHAKAIAQIFDDIFGDVKRVKIDTDEHDYPTGSGRVTFGNIESFKSAVLSNFIQIDSKKVKKRIQIEPCIDGQSCCICMDENVPNFCKNLDCFNYYCNSCWLIRHQPAKGIILDHSPIRRKSKNV